MGKQRCAEIVYPKKYRKPYRVPRDRIRDQRPLAGDHDPPLDMLLRSDEQVFRFVEQACDRDLNDLRKPPSLLQLVEQQREQARQHAAGPKNQPTSAAWRVGSHEYQTESR